MKNTNYWAKYRPHRTRRHTLGKFSRQDVADILGVSTRTLHRYCKKNRICLKKLSLGDLVEFINNYGRIEEGA